jgi:DNA mismatch repair protein MutS
MCGIPVHALDAYLERLIRKGVMVAVCDQIEAATTARQSRRLVKREVTRLVTPGTLTEEKFLEARKSNYLAAIAIDSNVSLAELTVQNKDTMNVHLSLAWLELSTGEFQMSPSSLQTLSTDLTRISPSELLVVKELENHPIFAPILKDYCVTPQPMNVFSAESGEQKLKQIYRVSNVQQLGDFSKLEIAASAALLHYIDLTQKGRSPLMSRPGRFSADNTMFIDATTHRALELTKTQYGDSKGSVLETLDRTVTGAGARLLASRLNAPLLSILEIERRLDFAEFFYKNYILIDKIRTFLRNCYDIERCIQRLSLNRGSPRDLAAIGATLHEAQNIYSLLMSQPNVQSCVALFECLKELNGQPFTELVHCLSSALVVDPPSTTATGGFIAPGYSKELDELRRVSKEGAKVIEELLPEYKARTGVTSMKLRNNSVLGYYIEVNTKEYTKLDASFIHCQTKVGSMCYKTEKIIELESKINHGTSKAIRLEQEIFDNLVKKILENSGELKALAHSLAKIDVATATALLAKERNYTRPIVNKGMEFMVKAGRHVTVEAMQQTTNFVTNDCHLTTEKNIWLITGANMGGKSTFLRQNALIAILAQAGFFIPAERAEIGLVDAVLSRVGAADDISRGRSSFLMEMLETANILHRATPRSLVIMDEIGRGTAVIDGMAIAWAIIEYLHDTIKCRALFATHYHKLTELENKALPKLACYHMAVKELETNPIFTHKVVKGSAQKSYGIAVAKIAGTNYIKKDEREESECL